MACEAGITYQASNLKFRIEKHITSGKHEKNTGQRVRQMTLAFTAQEIEFDRELATMLVMENIPLSKVEGKFLKPFIEKFTGKVLTSRSTLRNTFMPKMYSNYCAELLQKFKGKDYLIMVDEATDVRRRSVCGALIGTFNEVEKPVLFDLVELSETNKKISLNLSYP